MGKKVKAKNETPEPVTKKGDKKKKGVDSNNGADANASAGKGKVKGNRSLTDESTDAKKPARGLVIGDNFGWTGKLPVTLLNEHCQKQKWNKCDYSMMKKSSGVVCIVTLSWENPKTKELISIKFKPDYTPKETTNEARHMSATFVLHRINYIKNMKMLLPIIFRDYWTDLENERAKLLKENKYLHDIRYNINPFVVYIEQEELKKKLAKEKLDKMNQEAKVHKPAVSLGHEQGNSKVTTLANSLPRKVWESAPLFDIPSELRADIELSVREYLDWSEENLRNNKGNEKHGKEKDNFGKLEQDEDKSLIDKLVNLGFRRNHVKESLQFTSTFTDALEWLIFHLPEDDLPSSFLKSETESDVVLKVSRLLKTELAMKRLKHSGFSEDIVLRLFEECGEDDFATAIALTKLLDTGLLNLPLHISEEESQELWDQEVEALSMAKTNIEINSHNVVTIPLLPENIKGNKVSVQLFKSPMYPNELPGIQIVVKNEYKIANYVKLAIVKSLISELHVGECMLYSIVEWLELNLMDKIQNPGSLCMYEKINDSATSQTTRLNLNYRSSQKRNKAQKLDPQAVKKLYESRLKELKQDRGRELLPAWKKRDALVQAINSNQITLVTGETGSGKSTQVVQYILDDLNEKGDFSSTIICTQPRRISAMGLANRVAEERKDEVGRETGYIIRGESKVSGNTRISFVTTGILLRMLQNISNQQHNETESGLIFEHLRYIFIDEVHERSVDSDFLLIILRDLVKRFKNLKIILMSATIKKDKFDQFFKSTIEHTHVEGRTYPIQDLYLNDVIDELDYKMEVNGDLITPRADAAFFKMGNINYDLLAQLIKHVHKKLAAQDNDGSLLVFLPGVGEINRAVKETSLNLSGILALPLHSSLSPQEQKRVFAKPLRGTRKVVFATNIAETSITIPDCVVVIDTGRSKNMFFDPALNATKLIEEWCSQAEIKQRRGRAGRVTSGLCYHLYTKETELSMLVQPIPEIKRVRLENLYLIVKSMGISNVEKFIASGLDAPDKQALSSAQRLLEDVGALDSGNLTNLGRYLSYLPTDPHTGKLLILGCIFDCLDMCVTLAAINSVGSIFINNLENREKVKQILNRYSGGYGDLIAEAKVYLEYSKNPNKLFIRENCLSYTALKDVKSTKAQFLQLILEMGFTAYGSIGKSEAKINYALVMAIVTGSLYPNIIRVQYPNQKYLKTSLGSVAVDPEAKQIKLWVKNDSQDLESLPLTRVFIHPSSVMFSTKDYEPNDASSEDDPTDISRLAPQVPKADLVVIKTPFLTYKSSHLTSKLYIRGITPSTTISTLLFGGKFEYEAKGLLLNGWLPIRTWCKNGVLIKQVRKLLDKYIDEKLSTLNSTTHEAIFEVITRVVNL